MNVLIFAKKKNTIPQNGYFGPHGDIDLNISQSVGSFSEFLRFFRRNLLREENFQLSLQTFFSVYFPR